jgi:hypothetical protein
MDTPTAPIDTAATTERRTGSRRRRRAAAIALVVVLALVLASLRAASDGRPGASAPSQAGGSGPSGPSLLASGGSSHPDGAGVSDGGSSGSGAGDDATEDALDAEDDSHGYPDEGADVGTPSGSGGGGGSGDVDLDPVPGIGACAGLGAGGASLLVTPDPAVLPAGTLSSSLSVTNCGVADVSWTAATVPSVSLGSENGTLAGGSTAKVDFAIDPDAYEPGAVDFKVKVSEPGHNHYVDVHAFRPAFGKDMVAGNGQLSAGEDAGGCANQCIVKAWLTPNVSTPDLSLEVKTHTPATIRMWVAKQAPNGLAVPDAASPAGATAWTTSVSPLQPATKYFLLLKATDGNGKTSTRATSFTTITPYENPGGLANPGGPAGCAVQCITTAKLTAGGDFSSKKLEVKSNTPARFQAMASTKAPTYHQGVPSFATADSSSLSGLEYLGTWTTTLSKLAGATTYHVIVRATDAKGHDAYRVGTFTTPPEPTRDVGITFLSIRVTHDGDSSWKNRGELSFAWGVGDTKVGSLAEDKISDPATVGVPRGKSIFVVNDAKGFLPTVYVSASERDADGLVEFCSMGTGVPHEAGSNGDCDAKWNVASSGIVSVDGIATMPRCTAFGLSEVYEDTACMQLETVSHGDDYPRFTAIVAFNISG